MMSKKLYFLFVFLFIAQPAWSLTLDWKGFSRTEVYYENSRPIIRDKTLSKTEVHYGVNPEKFYYGNFHLVLKPEIRVIDGLSVFSRLDLHPFSPSVYSSSNRRQTGVVFLNSIESSKSTEESNLLFLNLSQIYVTYKTEFFKLKLGKAPYHFGLGVTYSAETSPFDHWISTFNQMALYFEYSHFYLQPSVFLDDGETISINQIGMQGDKWNVEALVQYNLTEEESFIEAFGTYKEGSVDTKLSVSYFFADNEDKDNEELAVVFEGGIDLPIRLSPRFELKGGYASEWFRIHPNYNVALLLGNRVINLRETKKTQLSDDDELAIAEGRIHDVAYLSPRISFHFLQDTLKITPIVSLDYKLSDEKLRYELDLQAHYKLEENFSVLIQGGVLRVLEKNYIYGFLAQAAVTF